MKSTTILIILYEIIELFEITKSDHVQVIRCIEHPQCMNNIDGEILEVIKENILNTTDPCENFCDYACGSWTAEPYYDHVDNFEAMSNYYADQLIKTLKELKMKEHKEHRDLYKLINQITKYFVSCRTTSTYYLHMWNYLKEIPECEIFGDNFKWNLFLTQNSSIWQQFDWLKALASLRKFGLNDVFLHESMGFAWNDSSQYVLQLKIPHADINFPNKYKVLQLMQEYDLIQNSKNLLTFAQEIYEFDQELVELYKEYEHSKSDHFITYQDLQILVPFMDWKLYFETLCQHSIESTTPIEFSGHIKYFKDLNTLLVHKPKRIVGFYTLMRFCKYLLDIRPLISDRECLLHTNVMFPLGVNYLYNHLLYHKDRLKDEQILQSIFSKLKQQFSIYLQENKFSLSLQEISYLKDKLIQMQLQIGNLPSNTSHINDYYLYVELSTLNFYHNHLEMLKFRTLKQHEVFLTPTQTHIDLHAYYLNDDISQLRNAPYFIHQRNTLIVPMLFLQLPFYHHSQHSVLQYSLVGWIIAHELSHAFDLHGLQLDAWGNENLIGLQISHKVPYLTATKCLLNFSPTVFLNERMADVNGLQLAWQAYFHQYSNVSQVCDFSLQQLFFINFSQFFCGSLPRPLGHDRDDVRVKVAVANLQEFSEVFQCSKDATENPNEKCNIWRK